MFWPTGVPVSATSTSRPRQAHMTKAVAISNRRLDLTNDLVELSLLMYYGETEPYKALLRDCARDGEHPEPPASDAVSAAYASGRKPGKEKEKEKEKVLTALDVLTSPLREREIIDFWSPYELAIFEAALCKLGVDKWSEFTKYLPKKAVDDVKKFFDEIYSKTTRYLSYKNAVTKNSATRTQA